MLLISWAVNEPFSLSMNLVAADVSPRHICLGEVSADSRRRLRFRGSKREVPFRRILTPTLARWERENLSMSRPMSCD